MGFGKKLGGLKENKIRGLFCFKEFKVPGYRVKNILVWCDEIEWLFCGFGRFEKPRFWRKTNDKDNFRVICFFESDGLVNYSLDSRNFFWHKNKK